MKMLIISILLSYCLTASQTQAASINQVVIYWDNPKQFSDINAGANLQRTFTKRVKQTLNKKFAELAGRLPQGYRWTIHIHDINLAGKISRAYRTNREPLRVFETSFNPSMNFSYQVLDKTNKVVANNKHFKLTDFYVSQYPAPRFMHRFLSYEKYMLNAWFDKVLLPYVLKVK